VARDEVLRSIKEAEEKTGAKLENARTASSNIPSNAGGMGADLFSSVLPAAVAAAQSMVDQARDAANKQADSARADGEAALTAIHEHGEKNRSSAVDAVLDAFLQS